MKKFICILAACSFLLSANIFAEDVSEIVDETKVASPEASTEGVVAGSPAEEAAPLSPAFELERFDGTVTKVESADIIFIDGKKFKLIGIDAPKRWWWQKPRQCYSGEAAAYLEDVALDKPVQYAYLDLQGPRDGLGLKQIYLFKGDSLINAELVQKGYALAYQKRWHPELENFKGYQANAKFYQLGLWHRCAVECNEYEICKVKDW